MSVKVLIPTPLRSFVGGQDSLVLEGPTVAEVLAELVRQHPSLKPHLFSEGGELRSFVNVYLNDTDIRHLEQGGTLLDPGDTLVIVPSIAGGNRVAQPGLSPLEVQRYSRHLILPEVGVQGQLRLREASVLCIGAGGLGSPLALYLAAAGVGRLGIVDFDVVEYSNLQRQILHSTADVGRSKLASARDSIEAINPEVKVETFEARLTSQNALELIQDFDLVADGTDNFPTRYLVNDACVLTGRPNVYGSIFRFEGQASVFGHDGGPCYRCLYPEPPPPGLVPSCAEGGVLGILPGLIGVIQATEALKLLLGRGESLSERLLLIDALDMKFRELKVRRDPSCPICGDQPTIRQLIDYEAFCGIGAEQDENRTADVAEITATALNSELASKPGLRLLDVRNPNELEICRLEGALTIPLDQLSVRSHELDPEWDLVVFCRSGVRSLRAITQLQELGYKRLTNLKGGILAWADEIDPDMAKY